MLRSYLVTSHFLHTASQFSSLAGKAPPDPALGVALGERQPAAKKVMGIQLRRDEHVVPASSQAAPSFLPVPSTLPCSRTPLLCPWALRFPPPPQPARDPGSCCGSCHRPPAEPGHEPPQLQPPMERGAGRGLVVVGPGPGAAPGQRHGGTATGHRGAPGWAQGSAFGCRYCGAQTPGAARSGDDGQRSWAMR